MNNTSPSPPRERYVARCGASEVTCRDYNSALSLAKAKAKELPRMEVEVYKLVASAKSAVTDPEVQEIEE
jgi:hypothetical protein